MSRQLTDATGSFAARFAPELTLGEARARLFVCPRAAFLLRSAASLLAYAATGLAMLALPLVLGVTLWLWLARWIE
jgi:hypothetical protein